MFVPLKAQTKLERCISLIQASSMSKAASLIEDWENSTSLPPNFYICKFNYYLKLAQETNLEIKGLDHLKTNTEYRVQSHKTDKGLNLIDSLKNSKTIQINSPQKAKHFLTEQAIITIKEGIKHYPHHLNMRFGLLSIYQEQSAYTLYLKQLEKTLTLLQEKRKFYWNNNKNLLKPRSVILGIIQKNFYYLFSNLDSRAQKKDILNFLTNYANLIIKYFPKEKYGYSNKACILYQTQKDKDALGYFQKAQKIDPNDHLITFNIAIIYKNLNQYKYSKKLLESLLARVKEPDFLKEINTILKQEIYPKTS